MDPQIEELKELIRRNTALAEDTNRIVHKMRRGALLSSIMRLLWWALIIGATVASYLYFAPYLQQITDLYSKAQTTLQQFQAGGGLGK